MQTEDDQIWADLIFKSVHHSSKSASQSIFLTFIAFFHLFLTKKRSKAQSQIDYST